MLEQGYPDVSAPGAGGAGMPGEGVPPYPTGACNHCYVYLAGAPAACLRLDPLALWGCCAGCTALTPCSVCHVNRLDCPLTACAPPCLRCSPSSGGNAVLLEETGGNASHLYVDVVGECTLLSLAAAVVASKGWQVRACPRQALPMQAVELHSAACNLGSAKADMDAPKTFQGNALFTAHNHHLAPIATLQRRTWTPPRPSRTRWTSARSCASSACSSMASAATVSGAGGRAGIGDACGC